MSEKLVGENVGKLLADRILQNQSSITTVKTALGELEVLTDEEKTAWLATLKINNDDKDDTTSSTSSVDNSLDATSSRAVSNAVVTSSFNQVNASLSKLETEVESLQIAIKDLEFPTDYSTITWENSSWEDIDKMLAAHYSEKISVYDYWNIGDTRTVRLNAINAYEGLESHVEQDIKLVLGNKGGVNITGTEVPCAFEVMQYASLANGATQEPGAMHLGRSNVGGWEDSPRRAWCNNAYYNALPSELRSILQQCDVKACVGNNSNQVQVSSDYISLLSIINVFGVIGDSAPGEGVQWDIFKENILTPARPLGATSTDKFYWTRSAMKSSVTHYMLVSSTGTREGNGADQLRGILPIMFI